MPIRGENLTVAYYGDIHVLREVTVEAQNGLVTCVIGPNGAGKSTLLKTLFGYLSPQVGQVLLERRGHHRARAAGSDAPGSRLRRPAPLGVPRDVG